LLFKIGKLPTQNNFTPFAITLPIPANTSIVICSSWTLLQSLLLLS
jgi:hypothetical protein